MGQPATGAPFFLGKIRREKCAMSKKCAMHYDIHKTMQGNSTIL